ncbi:gamma carbonic anhydrase family protein [Thalassorhabdomicrobium marinisediminis]|uniref:Gamma carbonic anhydrase family protein n=1 Tax=Thalassorhabdomicrobium marinisediminis TaxID=2170577 RepID=A0A2T7FUT8_9RHOB|nr:gamma carbonic anhydrase family protein [Thalassorhabdomicrobium marinisediminis]PVA05925.1 gamma carbonic anhydrase family protein [Thalassorhabdomicrobium marinisediminis]
MLYELDGHAPQVHPDAWIAPGCHIIGKVVIEAGASIWFGTTIRGDNETITVGAGSNVQENCVLHTDMGYRLTIGKNCTVGHKAMLHGCTIGDTTLIGMNATVLNGARVGQSCLIGAGALVTEGKEIADRSLVVGISKVVRELDDAATKALATSAENYQNNAARFRKGLAPL